MLELAKAAVMCPCSWWRRVPQVSPWDRRLRPLELQCCFFSCQSVMLWKCLFVKKWMQTYGCRWLKIPWLLGIASVCTMEDLGSMGVKLHDLRNSGQVWHASLHDGGTRISGEISYMLGVTTTTSPTSWRSQNQINQTRL